MNTEPLTWCFVGCHSSKRKPVLILETREETLAYLENPTPGVDHWAVCSLYLCDFMDALDAHGFVYNSTAIRAFQEAHGMPVDGVENGSTLSRLVYNCQCYREARRLEREGWRPGSPELLREAYDSGQGIIMCGHNFLGGKVQEVFRVREIGGNLYAMRPRKRKYSVRIAGQPCKVVPLNTAPAEPKGGVEVVFA